jgi:hypothetical protein
VDDAETNDLLDVRCDEGLCSRLVGGGGVERFGCLESNPAV